MGFLKKRDDSGAPAGPKVDLQTRKAKMDDASAIAAILRELGWWPDLLAEPFEATVARVMGHIRSCNTDQSHSIYVVVGQGEVLGYVAVHWLPYLFLPGPEGYVSELFVLSKARAMGVGRLLLAEAKKEALERGCSRLALLNNRKRESYKRRFYQKLGWEERKEMANIIFKLK